MENAKSNSRIECPKCMGAGVVPLSFLKADRRCPLQTHVDCFVPERGQPLKTWLRNHRMRIDPCMYCGGSGKVRYIRVVEDALKKNKKSLNAALLEKADASVDQLVGDGCLTSEQARKIFELYYLGKTH